MPIENCESSFNPRTRAGCDKLLPTRVGGLFMLSIHAPARGATALFGSFYDKASAFQSTHPRGVRLFPSVRIAQAAHLSIHAPARGATRYARVRAAKTPLSIHAPARGATVQPDPETKAEQLSIHAPARGATWSGGADANRLYIFQSTHPRGVRPNHDRIRPPALRSFNPRTRAGCDTTSSWPKVRTRTFNPRTRAGCDGPGTGCWCGS